MSTLTSRPTTHRSRLGAARRCLATAVLGTFLTVPIAAATVQTAAADPGTTTDRLILTGTADTATSTFVTWRSSSPSPAFVEYRPVGAASASVDATPGDSINDFTHFSAEVTGLTPETTYEYRVGREGDWTEWRSFTTAAQGAKPFEFIYYGDAQIDLPTTWPAVVNAAHAKAPNAVGSVHAGDLIDTASNQTQWTNWFAGMGESGRTTTVLAAPGNHEYSGDSLMRHWKANFQYPLNQPSIDTIGELAQLAEGDTPAAKRTAALFEHWTQFAGETVYYVDYQGVRFITLNATRNSTFLTPANLPACSGSDCPNIGALWIDFQAAWLDQILENNPHQWAVATFHQPVYSVSSGRDEPILRAAWVPVFQKHNIDLVLMGHDHTYARGFNNDDMTQTPGITTGPVYAVANSGGKYYSLASDAANVWTNNNATQVKRGANVSTYQVISVDGGTLTYESYVAAKNGNVPEEIGSLYDSFTITKTPSGKFVTEAGIEPPAAGDGEQALQVTVPEHTPEPGEFVWSIDGSNDLVDLGEATLVGDRLEALGAINPVRVTDTRAGAPEWSLSGQVGDFVSGGATIEGKYLGWAPTVTENTGGALAGAAVSSGLLGGEGLAASSVLGSAAAGHASGSSLHGADLELLLPVSASQGPYTAVLTLTALS